MSDALVNVSSSSCLILMHSFLELKRKLVITPTLTISLGSKGLVCIMISLIRILVVFLCNMEIFSICAFRHLKTLR